MVGNRRNGLRHRDTIADVEPLDNPVWHALTGPQARFSEGSSLALRYQPDVAAFSALPDEAGADAWNALAALVGPGRAAVIFRPSPLAIPADWVVPIRMDTLQMVATEKFGEPDPTFARLGVGDVAEMLALVERTRPGPSRSGRSSSARTWACVRNRGSSSRWPASACTPRVTRRSARCAPTPRSASRGSRLG